MELQARKRLIARCNPREVLEEDDDRYVDIDHIDEEHPPRRLAWVDEIARVFELAGTPQRLLLSGLPGSGKSTELRRVAARLERADGACLLPVLIDAEKVIDIDQPIGVPDLVLAVLAEVEAAVLKLEGQGDRPVGKENVFERFWNFMKSELESPEVEVKGVLLRLRSDPSLRERVRTSVSGRTTEFLERARRELNGLEKRVCVHEVGGRAIPGQPKYAGVFVVFDSLEKLRGYSDNFKAVLDSVVWVMSRAEHLALGVHTLFTVPLAAARRVEGVRLMPQIKVRDPVSLEPFEPGRRALRRVIEVRLGDAISEVLGSRAQDRIEAMIDRSGGYTRELLEILKLALHKDLPVSDRDFSIIFAERANEYERKIPREAIGMLKEIKKSKRPFVVKSEQPALEELLLTYSLVMVYQNDDEWTDINPAIARLLDQWQDP
ncbi:MAG: ATP-binding protein [Myxococcales bacterium]|nr:ATP-binding protein [Myxococcales bacterium]